MTSIILDYSVLFYYNILVSWIPPTCWCQFLSKCDRHNKSDHSAHILSVLNIFNESYCFVFIQFKFAPVLSCDQGMWPSHFKIESLMWYRFGLQKVIYIVLILIWYVLQDVFSMLYCTVKMISRSCHVMQWCWFNWIYIKLTLCAHGDWSFKTF